MAGRIENLTPWNKGVSGNPGGRPKKLSLDGILVELLEKNEGADALAIGEALVRKAKAGDLKAFQLIAERTQGRPSQKLNLDVGFNATLSQRMQRAEERMKWHKLHSEPETFPHTTPK